ncbi:STAS domain-containing protein [Nannocystis bainbridge]|uniref:Anti-sigma factor antagonist n=1 Tax=Nannocystis bainbridge TaxID=2995303 RepID=A0ABT5E7N3_9BACT|nr:STAS domain-containing protein [Nannocystis bainbridge]MDC0721438.1 STAS domain-containing protein [Nannocystis bainbridge]
MTITTRQLEDVTVLAPRGKLTIETGSTLRDAVRAALDNGARKLVLNLSEVTTVDSSGIGELVSAYTTANNQNARLKLAAVPPRVHDVLLITRLLSVFEVHESEDEAVRSFA